MSKYGLFDKVGDSQTEEEIERRKKLEKEAKNSSNKKSYFQKLKDKLKGE